MITDPVPTHGEVLQVQAAVAVHTVAHQEEAQVIVTHTMTTETEVVRGGDFRK